MIEKTRKRRGRTVRWLRETIIFAMFGAMMFAIKTVMAPLPNIHPIGMFIILLTIVYRTKALIPIYIYIALEGLFAPGVWWFPYLYIWAILWGITMLLPKNMKPSVAAAVYPVVCGLHGIAFGALYAPAQALMFGFDFKQTIAWIIAGLPFDALHGVGNLLAGVLILPLSELLKKIQPTNC